MEATYNADVQALKDSVEAFQEPETYKSVDNIKSAFQDVENNFNSAVEAGKQEKDANIASAQDSFDNLKTTVSSISSSDQTLGQKVTAVEDAIKQFSDELKQI